MSFLAWIDFDQKDRERAMQIMDLFGEEDSRDELGLGSIRDGLADLLFPATSTIQTRLRYMLFVPWIYRDVARAGGALNENLQMARDREIALIDALKNGGEQRGVVGSEAGKGLKRLPSDIYWAGLGHLGIRRFQGSRQEYLARRLSSADATDLWAAGLPAPPEDMFTQISFTLTPHEAGFVKDRLLAEFPASLLTELARTATAPDCDMVWQCPDQSGWSPQHKAIVHHGEVFSDLMHGAALLYNLQLAQLAAQNAQEQATHWQDKVDEYLLRLDSWKKDCDLSRLDRWKPKRLWSVIDCEQVKIPALTRRFTESWRQVVLDDDAGIEASPEARQLIQQRETRLKRGKSRFSNPAALARWGGASGTARLNYRWPVVRSHLKDLANAG